MIQRQHILKTALIRGRKEIHLKGQKSIVPRRTLVWRKGTWRLSRISPDQLPKPKPFAVIMLDGATGTIWRCWQNCKRKSDYLGKAPNGYWPWPY